MMISREFGVGRMEDGCGIWMGFEWDHVCSCPCVWSLVDTGVVFADYILIDSSLIAAEYKGTHTSENKFPHSVRPPY